MNLGVRDNAVVMVSTNHQKLEEIEVGPNDYNRASRTNSTSMVDI